MMAARPDGAGNWDAGAYDRLSGPQYAWGQRVLDRLGLRGDETVLDAGCGTGRLTALLLVRLPHGKVIAVDKSEAMLAEARSLRPSTSHSWHRSRSRLLMMTGHGSWITGA